MIYCKGSLFTLQTTPIDIRVLKGNGSVSDAMEVNLPKEDILPLKLGNSSLSVVDDSFFGSVAYFLTLGLLLAACGILSFCLACSSFCEHTKKSLLAFLFLASLYHILQECKEVC